MEGDKKALEGATMQVSCIGAGKILLKYFALEGGKQNVGGYVALKGETIESIMHWRDK